MTDDGTRRPIDWPSNETVMAAARRFAGLPDIAPRYHAPATIMNAVLLAIAKSGYSFRLEITSGGEWEAALDESETRHANAAIAIARVVWEQTDA